MRKEAGLMGGRKLAPCGPLFHFQPCSGDERDGKSWARNSSRSFPQRSRRGRGAFLVGWANSASYRPSPTDLGLMGDFGSALAGQVTRDPEKTETRERTVHLSFWKTASDPSGPKSQRLPLALLQCLSFHCVNGEGLSRLGQWGPSAQRSRGRRRPLVAKASEPPYTESPPRPGRPRTWETIRKKTLRTRVDNSGSFVVRSRTHPDDITASPCVAPPSAGLMRLRPLRSRSCFPRMEPTRGGTS
ncbi:uncharacterized protein LOC127539610 isoform X2 [Antechinus flavipes]|uniref:uncharacterized protein LOC127539610 isoform X2 n=1 Tax=Antechinus flavipes TaxID=38775 RepID=UPI002236AF9D|nr:uncharacterized protein LOC127539610 isoform X2 [Antechinus flavipes]